MGGQDVLRPTALVPLGGFWSIFLVTMSLVGTQFLVADSSPVPAYTSPNQANRIKMKALCRAAGSYAAAARRIAEQTQRPLSVESIKAWTCDPKTSRARPCPDWAIKALERNLDKRACEGETA